MSTTTARPERGTVKQVASCATCWEMLVKYPGQKRWVHAASGETNCSGYADA